jgi:hypothetical protein
LLARKVICPHVSKPLLAYAAAALFILILFIESEAAQQEDSAGSTRTRLHNQHVLAAFRGSDTIKRFRNPLKL